MPPVKPMLAKAVDLAPSPLRPDDLPAGALSFEPKWDGFRCVVFRDGDELFLGSRNDRPFNRYFPEMLPVFAAQLPNRCVVDGELAVVIDDRLDFDALGQRIHPAESRVTMLAAKTPASFIAFDLLALDDHDLRDVAFRDRRRLLETMAGAFSGPLLLTPSTTDRATAIDWFERVEGAGLDGLIAKPLEGQYIEDKRVQYKLKPRHTVDVVVAGFRWHKDGQGVGSLLLGLYDATGRLQHLGVAASFTAAVRRALVDELASLKLDDVSGHPWAGWADPESHVDGRMPGAPSRWSGARGDAKDHSWVPLRPERVAEVAYVTVTSGRFRGTTRFERWRPDRDPESCATDQLHEPASVGFSSLVAIEPPPTTSA